MTKIAPRTAGRKPSRRPDATQDAVPAPTAGLFRLLSMLGRRPLPLGELRPAAAAAGLSTPEVDAALALATRRGAIALVLAGGVACVERRRGA